MLFCLSAPAWSRAAAPPEDPAHNELRALRDGLLDAIAKNDLDRELTFMHPNVVVTWHNAEVSRGHAGMRSYLTRMLSGPARVVASFSAEVNVDELSILYGGDAAISWGSSVEHFKLANGKSFDLPGRWSATLVKENGKWLIANLHASDNLFDNPMLHLAQRTAYWAGGICLVVGVFIGALVARKRKSSAT